VTVLIPNLAIGHGPESFTSSFCQQSLFVSVLQVSIFYSGIRIFDSLPRSIINLKNEKTQFKVALKEFLNAHSFYSVDEFFTCTDDMYCWLYDCVNVSYSVTFLLFVCLWHVPHPIILWLLRIYGMYMCMYVYKRCSHQNSLCILCFCILARWSVQNSSLQFAVVALTA
jgi:hypothetical protein